MRDYDRRELEVNLKDLVRRLQVIEETGEEATCELQDRVRELNTELRFCDPRYQEDYPWMRKLTDTSMGQAQVLRRLEAVVAEPWRAQALPHEFTGVFVRMDALELRVECLEQSRASMPSM